MAEDTWEVKVPSRHGGTWTITREPCHLAPDLGVWMYTTRPGSEGCEDMGYCLIPDWNGWRFSAYQGSIALPLNVLEAMIALTKEKP